MRRYLSVRVLLAASVVVVGVVALARDSRDFRIRDDCDPATFNAAFGDGICATNFDGETTVDEFLVELTEEGSVGHWRFNPDRVTLERREQTSFESRGGEFHTFTRVDEFGGGIIAGLNDLSGAGDVRPECGIIEEGDPDGIGELAAPSATNVFVDAGAELPGPRAGSNALPVGTTKWQCCIHPWMRTTADLRTN